jgi:hypothetical protein
MGKIGDLMVGLSIVAVILSIIGAFGTDLWLASTQWVLVAAVFGIYAIYFKK